MTKTKKSKKMLLAAVACTATLALSLSTLYTPLAVLAEESSDVTDSERTIYTTDYNTMEEAQAAAEKLTAEIASEGASLLKNENKALPLSGNAWISVFGVTEQGLEGSGASDNVDVTVSGALQDAGFNVNPTLKDYYGAHYATAGNNSSVGSGNSNIGKEDTTFNAQVKGSWKTYNDAAIVVFSRTGAEGSDALLRQGHLCRALDAGDGGNGILQQSQAVQRFCNRIPAFAGKLHRLCIHRLNLFERLSKFNFQRLHQTFTPSSRCLRCW